MARQGSWIGARGRHILWYVRAMSGRLDMRRMVAVAVFSLGASAIPGVVHADSYWDLEHARGNARAGGPVSEQDAELLERWGCLSGTESSFCQRLRVQNRRAWSNTERKRERR